MEKSGFHMCDEVYVLPSSDGSHYIIHAEYDGPAVTDYDWRGDIRPNYQTPQSMFYQESEGAKPIQCPADAKSIQVPSWAFPAEPTLLRVSVFHEVLGGENVWWLEISEGNAAGRTTGPTLKQLDEAIRMPLPAALSGLTYNTTAQKKGGAYILRLPKCFAIAHPSLKDGDMLPVWYSQQGETLVIEAPMKVCACCGNLVRSTYKRPARDVTMCRHCAAELRDKGTVRNIVQAERALIQAHRFL